MKKLLLIVMAFAIVFMMAACGGNGETQGSNQPASQTEAGTEPDRSELSVLTTEGEPESSAESQTETSSVPEGEPQGGNQPTSRTEAEAEAEPERSELPVPATEDETEPSAEPQAETSSVPEGGKMLIAYFSRTGNTETVANMIAGQTGGELFKIETVNPYPEDYNECIELARQEQDDNARPELSSHVSGMEDYDVVFLGYPNWWGTMPMALFTFLEEYDFSGKTIIPFCTHGGSALGSSERDIAALCSDAVLLEGLAVRGANAGNAQNDVDAWIGKLTLPLD
jgi:flavodoxin